MALPEPLDGTGATELAIPDIVRLARAGEIRIPEFQRSFVWDASDVRKLFDSIYRGFPIGTILLWRHPAEGGVVHLGPIELDVPKSGRALWVVDGQQRIISLVGSLMDSETRIDERFEVYFDLASKAFVNERQAQVNPRAIPVREALGSRQVANWTRRHADDLELDDFDTADSLVGVLRDYRIPAYIVATNDQALLREIFDRVNSAGKAISRAQIFHALFASGTNEGSPASVASALEKTGFGRLDDGRILQSLLAVRGGNVQRDIHDEFEPVEDPAEWFDVTESALRRAIEFLQGQGITHLLLMPNTLPIPVLAAFFHVHPSPNAWIRRLLARWLWRGWVNGFGTESGQTPIMRRAISTINPRRLHQDQAPDAYDALKRLLQHVSDHVPTEMKISPLRSDKATGRVVQLALADQVPRNLSGEKIDIVDLFNSSGAAALTELVRGHRSLAGARAFWPSSSPLPTGDEDPRILRSHVISAEVATALQARKIPRFLEVREEDVRQLVTRFVTARIEAGAPTRPPLENLIVADPDDDASNGA